MVLTLECGIAGHEWTLEDIDLLKRDYKPHKPYIMELARRIGCTCGAVRTKASKLKLTTPQRHWTDDEDDKLCDLAASYPRRKVARILHRSEESVVCRLKVLRRKALARDWYTCQDVALILGVERRWVSRRIALRMLKAVDHYHPNGDRIKAYHIKREDLIEFIVKYPAELQGLKPDMVSFIDLLTTRKR